MTRSRTLPLAAAAVLSASLLTGCSDSSADEVRLPEPVLDFPQTSVTPTPTPTTTEAEETERALRHLRRTIELEGPSTIAAIVLESIPGTAGIMIPTPEYMQGVRALADEHGIVLIADEVMAGFGRTGLRSGRSGCHEGLS